MPVVAPVGLLIETDRLIVLLYGSLLIFRYTREITLLFLSTIVPFSDVENDVVKSNVAGPLAAMMLELETDAWAGMCAGTAMHARVSRASPATRKGRKLPICRSFRPNNGSTASANAESVFATE